MSTDVEGVRWGEVTVFVKEFEKLRYTLVIQHIMMSEKFANSLDIEEKELLSTLPSSN